MKRITAIILALVLTLAVGAFTVMAEEYQTGIYVISVNDPDPNECFLNVRAGVPGSGQYNEILGQVWDGTEVKVVEIANTDWGKIEFGDGTGWIRLKNYTTFITAEVPSEPESSEIPSEPESSEEPSTEPESSEEPSTEPESSEEPSSDEPVYEEALYLKEDSALTQKDGLRGVKAGQIAAEIINEFENTNVFVFDSEGNKVDDSAKVGTGYEVRLIHTSDETIVTDSAVIIIVGDVTGDGVVDGTDYLRINGEFLGTFDLEGAYRSAGDVDGSGIIDGTDYLRIKGHFLGTYQLYA